MQNQTSSGGMGWITSWWNGAYGSALRNAYFLCLSLLLIIFIVPFLLLLNFGIIFLERGKSINRSPMRSIFDTLNVYY